MACGFVAEAGCGGGGRGGGGRWGRMGCAVFCFCFWFVVFLPVGTGLLTPLQQCVSLACLGCMELIFNYFSPHSSWYDLCCLCFSSPASSFSYLAPGVAYRPPPPFPSLLTTVHVFILYRGKGARFFSPPRQTRVEFLRRVKWYEP